MVQSNSKVPYAIDLLLVSNFKQSNSQRPHTANQIAGYLLATRSLSPLLALSMHWCVCIVHFMLWHSIYCRQSTIIRVHLGACIFDHKFKLTWIKCARGAIICAQNSNDNSGWGADREFEYEHTMGTSVWAKNKHCHLQVSQLEIHCRCCCCYCCLEITLKMGYYAWQMP